MPPVRNRYGVHHSDPSRRLDPDPGTGNNVAHQYGKTATFMPSSSSATTVPGMHCSTDLEGRQEPGSGDGYAGPSEFVLYSHRRHHRPRRALNAITNPGKPTLQASGCPISKLRSNGFSQEPFHFHPYPVRGLHRAHAVSRIHFPDPIANPYPGLLRPDDGRPGRRTEQIHLATLPTRTWYDLPPEEGCKILTVCAWTKPWLPWTKRSRVPSQRCLLQRLDRCLPSKLRDGQRWLRFTDHARLNSTCTTASDRFSAGKKGRRPSLVVIALPALCPLGNCARFGTDDKTLPPPPFF